MKRYKRFFTESIFSYLDLIKESIINDMDIGAQKAYPGTKWKFIFGKDVTLEGAVLSWTQTGVYKKYSNLILDLLKQKSYDKIVDYDKSYSNLKNIAEAILICEQLLKVKLDNLTLFRVQDNDISSYIQYAPISFSKVDYRTANAGTFKLKNHKYLIIIRNAKRGFDISNFSSRDKSEQEVIVYGKYMVLNKIYKDDYTEILLKEVK